MYILPVTGSLGYPVHGEYMEVRSWNFALIHHQKVYQGYNDYFM